MRAQNPTLTIRLLEARDAEAAAELCAQLGYERTPAELQQWLLQATTGPQRQVAFAACLGEQVVGWIQLEVVHHLQSAPHVSIAGLVVKDSVRGAGIGKRLCERAEQWTQELGLDRIRLTSRSSRLDAHRFYLREGYAPTKVSMVFEKTIPPASRETTGLSAKIDQ